MQTLEQSQQDFQEKYGQEILKTAGLIHQMTTENNIEHLTMLCEALYRMQCIATNNVIKLEKQQQPQGWTFDFSAVQ